MEKISSVDDLKNTIQSLETEFTLKDRKLREQFYLTYESLKPVNLLKSTLKDIASSPFLIDNILGAVISLGTGYLSKKIVVGTSGNIYRRFLGSVLQFSVINLVSNHSVAIKAFGQYLFQLIFHKKEANSDK